MVDQIPQLYLMQAVVAGQIAEFAKFPPRQKPASFNLDAVLVRVSRPRQRITPQGLAWPWHALLARPQPTHEGWRARVAAPFR